MAALREDCFNAWPSEAPELSSRLLDVEGRGSGVVMRYDIEVGDGFQLSAAVAAAHEGREVRMVMLAVDAEAWGRWAENDFEALRARAQKRGEIVNMVAVRGGAGSAWTSDKKEHVQVRRRFMLLGTTLDAMRVWDVRRAIAWAKTLNPDLSLWLEAEGVMAQNALYASLFEDGIASLTLLDIPRSHRGGATYLNVLRYLDVPAALAMAAERCPVTLYGEGADEWTYAFRVAELLGFGENVAIGAD
jgi:hypothetical protein